MLNNVIKLLRARDPAGTVGPQSAKASNGNKEDHANYSVAKVLCEHKNILFSCSNTQTVRNCICFIRVIYGSQG